MSNAEYRWVLAFRDGGDYVSLDRNYYPPVVNRRRDPLDATRWSSAEDALNAIDNVFKQKAENYEPCRLRVEVEPHTHHPAMRG